MNRVFSIVNDIDTGVYDLYLGVFMAIILFAVLISHESVE